MCNARLRRQVQLPLPDPSGWGIDSCASSFTGRYWFQLSKAKAAEWPHWPDVNALLLHLHAGNGKGRYSSFFILPEIKLALRNSN
jgi:hypothetical protein